MKKAKLRQPGAGKSKPLVGGTDMPPMMLPEMKFKKGGMASKGKKC